MNKSKNKLEGRFLTADQVEDYLSISRSTLYKWMAHTTDPLRYYKMGKCLRFDIKDVSAWVDRRRIFPNNP